MIKNKFTDFPLEEEIRKAVSDLGYKYPTIVQQAVIPELLAGKDLLVQSQTGSGKTASFGIPICEKVEWLENKPQALILEPTRELAQQVQEDLINIGRYKRVKTTAVYGKASFIKQKSELKQKSHIVVGTPGRVSDHILKGTLSLDKIRYVVIDEADEMLNMGFIEQVKEIIQALPKQRQTLLFSATMPEKIVELSQNYLSEPKMITVEATEKTVPKIQHAFLPVADEEKFAALEALTVVENPDSCIIFCNTQEKVDNTYDHLVDAGYPVGKIHGGMIQEDRFEVMDAFRNKRFRYLVATDVAARGIDIENITHVINMDAPYEKESYIHRVGRTGRAGKEGFALTFFTAKDQELKKEIEAYGGFKMNQISLPNAKQVARSRGTFEKKITTKQVLQSPKGKALEQDIMKLYFNGGKKKKLRALDFVGTLTSIEGITAEDIGIITIQENVTYIDILNGKGSIVLQAMKDRTIKGKQLKVHKARKK
ncbi:MULTISPECIES: DEAD/DEAH box helicase [unclassified Enterococcus]|uniref:DEAD/DEAH box helicase n=1 Tax=unclassified Enterococcus TaxID=2608891 RepID=UPI001CE11FA3|nr:MULTISPECIES: DEAD/DEAH box helicase [unclassified Enterococcus]MCA5012938.1 DEAD/DEAH box helicase [Enterococcus sp. S23]MCA5016189.1 DEAD/DEAH box helicase [Enterococcus sp. S22(2020)]